VGPRFAGEKIRVDTSLITEVSRWVHGLADAAGEWGITVTVDKVDV
jgi:hypothetical protein